MANAFETKCSIRNSPIGIIPLSECSRRQKNECPCPARNGATPDLTVGVVVLGADTRRVPCEIKDDQRTNYYVGQREGKSNVDCRWDSLVGCSPRFVEDHAAVHALCNLFLVRRHGTIFG